MHAAAVMIVKNGEILPSDSDDADESDCSFIGIRQLLRATTLKILISATFTVFIFDELVCYKFSTMTIKKQFLYHINFGWHNDETVSHPIVKNLKAF